MNKIYNGKHKWFDGDCLKYCKNQYGAIDWKNSVGCIVEFQCYDYHGFYTILNMYPNPTPKKTKSSKNELLYEISFGNKNEIFVVNRNQMRNVNFKQELKINYTSDFLYNIGDIVDKRFLILNRERKEHYESDRPTTKTYTCQCLSDGYIFEVEERWLKDGKTCPVCGNRVVMVGVNDIATLKPEIVKFLVDKNDAYKYTATSSKMLNFKCDICETLFQSSPMWFTSSLPCGCYSAQSYPNRFISELFKQLNIPFITELRRRHFDWCDKYRYDLYFEYKDKKYIVEMDGWKHNELNRIEVDIIKDNLAQQHGIEVIRIDCDYRDVNKRFIYIKNHIMSSKLSTMFNLNDIEWEMINKKILTTNITKEVWELKNIGYTNKEVSNILNISTSEVFRCVQHGRELGKLDSYIKQKDGRHSKVMIIVNLTTLEKRYCIGIQNFYNHSLEYIGVKMCHKYFKENEINGHVILNGYDVFKITYGDYMKETINLE